jgi:UDP-glucose 4-epimerase
MITGVAGFIGSHLADHLIDRGHAICGVDNFLTGSASHVHPKVKFTKLDIRRKEKVIEEFRRIGKIDYVFHMAAIARTPWTIEDPVLANDVNVIGTLNVLLASRSIGVKKVVFASSNIVYAADTPYKVTKLAAEGYMRVFDTLFNVPTLSLRFSNVYGSVRQSEKGSAINCIANMRKSKRENGYVWVTGDGKQSRDFTHVEDVVDACIKGAQAKVHGREIDICTGQNVSIWEIAQYFNCPIRHIEERVGDIRHIYQNPEPAYKLLKFRAKRKLKDSMQVYL